MLDYIRQTLRSSQCDSLSADEERRLAIKAKSGGGDSPEAAAARDKLIMSQLRWAFRLSKKYAIRDNHALDDDDIFQVACQSVILAVDYFDPDKSRLTTYVAASVVRACRRHITHNGMPGICGASHPHAKSQLTCKAGYIEYDIAKQDAEGPDSCAALAEEVALLNSTVGRLEFRERAAIQLRLEGLPTGEIAKRLGVSRARFHQLEASGIRRMRLILGVMKEGNKGEGNSERRGEKPGERSRF